LAICHSSCRWRLLEAGFAQKGGGGGRKRGERLRGQKTLFGPRARPPRPPGRESCWRRGPVTKPDKPFPGPLFGCPKAVRGLGRSESRDRLRRPWRSVSFDRSRLRYLVHVRYGETEVNTAALLPRGLSGRSTSNKAAATGSRGQKICPCHPI